MSYLSDYIQTYFQVLVIQKQFHFQPFINLVMNKSAFESVFVRKRERDQLAIYGLIRYRYWTWL